MAVHENTSIDQLILLPDLPRNIRSAEERVLCIGRELGHAWCEQQLRRHRVHSSEHRLSKPEIMQRYSDILRSRLESLLASFAKYTDQFTGEKELRDLLRLASAGNADPGSLPSAEDLLQRWYSCSELIVSAWREIEQQLRKKIAQQESASERKLAKGSMLGETARTVLELLEALPKGEGLSGKEILAALARQGISIGHGTLTSRIMPQLMKYYGVGNRKGIGYFLISRQIGG